MAGGALAVAGGALAAGGGALAAAGGALPVGGALLVAAGAIAETGEILTHSGQTLAAAGRPSQDDEAATQNEPATHDAPAPATRAAPASDGGGEPGDAASEPLRDHDRWDAARGATHEWHAEQVAERKRLAREEVERPWWLETVNQAELGAREVGSGLAKAKKIVDVSQSDALAAIRGVPRVRAGGMPGQPPKPARP